ncbi:MAG: CsbD family protein [Myxococcales bacterium]|nr:CsbD family protein [Myxococcales bacterium]
MERDGRMDEAVGRAKEAAGALTDDDELRHEGKADQAAGKLKNALNEAVDKARGVVDQARDAVEDALGRKDGGSDDANRS